MPVVSKQLILLRVALRIDSALPFNSVYLAAFILLFRLRVAIATPYPHIPFFIFSDI